MALHAAESPFIPMDFKYFSQHSGSWQLVANCFSWGPNSSLYGNIKYSCYTFNTQSFLGMLPLGRLRYGCTALPYRWFQELLIISGKFAFAKATLCSLSLGSTWDRAFVLHGDWVGTHFCSISVPHSETRTFTYWNTNFRIDYLHSTFPFDHSQGITLIHLLMMCLGRLY